MMSESEAFEALRRWAKTNGIDADSIDGNNWTVAVHNNSWVMAPRGRSNAVYVVTPTEVRPVNRSVESLDDFLAGLD